MPPTSLRSVPSALPDSWAATPLTVVMPTYNEAVTLPDTARRVLELPLPRLQLMVVDDNSPDGTGTLAEEIAALAGSDGGRPRMTVLRRAGKDGLGRAYAAGMAQAVAEGAHYVMQMDADGSHPAEAVPRMLGTALANGCGLVVGSRYTCGGSLGEEWGLHRRLLSAWANRYAAAVLGVGGLRDITAGFNLWRADVLQELLLGRLTSAGYSFQVEAKYEALRAGHAAVEVPIHFGERTAGASKMTLSVQVESAVLPWRLRLRTRNGGGRTPRAGTDPAPTDRNRNHEEPHV